MSLSSAAIPNWASGNRATKPLAFCHAVPFGSVASTPTNGDPAGKYESSLLRGLLDDDEKEPQPASAEAASTTDTRIRRVIKA